MQLMAETTVFDDEKLNSDMQGVKQYFWHVEEGDDVGTHITEIPQDEFVVTPSGYNFLATSRGLAIRDALDELSQFTADYVQIGTSADNNVYIDDASVNIRNGTTVVASFDEDDIYLGKNSTSSVIHLCDDTSSITYDTTNNWARFCNGVDTSSDYVDIILGNVTATSQILMRSHKSYFNANAVCFSAQYEAFTELRSQNTFSGLESYIRVNTDNIYIAIKRISGTINNYVQIIDSKTTFGADVYAPNFIQSSDINLKDNIKPLDNNIIYALQPIDFTWKDSIDTKRHYGFIAQDVLKLIGDNYGLVKGDEYLGISYSEIIPLCVDAIQSHKKVIDSLVKELKELKGEK